MNTSFKFDLAVSPIPDLPLRHYAFSRYILAVTNTKSYYNLYILLDVALKSDKNVTIQVIDQTLGNWFRNWKDR